jgi:hypothetical protein
MNRLKIARNSVTSRWSMASLCANASSRVNECCAVFTRRDPGQMRHMRALLAFLSCCQPWVRD